MHHLQVYAIGLESTAMWQSIPTALSTSQFKWYGGATHIAQLTGNGNLSVTGSLSAPSISSTGTITAPTLSSTTTITTPSLTINGGGLIIKDAFGNDQISFRTDTISTVYSDLNIGGSLNVSGVVSSGGDDCLTELSATTLNFSKKPYVAFRLNSNVILTAYIINQSSSW